MSRTPPTPFRRDEGSGARNLSERICLILNPRAGAGRAGQQIGTLEKAADRAFAQWEIRQTRAQGDGTRLAHEAADEGFDLIAAVGGDGTCNEVVNGLMQRGVRPKAAFTVIPFGTGSDLIKTLEVPRSLNEALWVAATGITLPTDVGRATVSGPEGERVRWFLNVAGFGANGDVVLRANAMNKSMGGTVTFLRATLASVMNYRAAELDVRWSGPEGDGQWQGRCLSAFIANGAYCGGGMWVGKGGTMHDGHLDLTLIPDKPLVTQLALTPRLYAGTIQHAAGVIRAPATRVEVRPLADDAVHIDLDGEMPGTLPARFELSPRALQVRGGWTRNPLLNT